MAWASIMNLAILSYMAALYLPGLREPVLPDSLDALRVLIGHVGQVAHRTTQHAEAGFSIGVRLYGGDPAVGFAAAGDDPLFACVQVPENLADPGLNVFHTICSNVIHLPKYGHRD